MFFCPADCMQNLPCMRASAEFGFQINSFFVNLGSYVKQRVGPRFVARGGMKQKDSRPATRVLVT